MSGYNVNDALEAEERDGSGLEAPSSLSSCSCSSIHLMVSFLLLDGMATLCSARKLRIFVKSGSSSCSSCAQPGHVEALAKSANLEEIKNVQNKKLAGKQDDQKR